MSASSDDEEETAELSSSPSSSQGSTVSVRQGPVHKSYVSLASRLKTFDNPRWPRDCPMSVPSLAEAGFFYHGPFMGYEDSVKCFYCDTGLCRWEPEDDPWKEHRRVAPNCEFVRLNFPSPRNTNTQEVTEEWMSSSLVQEFLKNNKCSKNVVKNVLSQKWLKTKTPFKTMDELREAVFTNDPLR